MKPRNRFWMIVIPLMLALMLSAAAVRPAFADGSPPPPADSPASPAGAASSTSNGASDSTPADPVAGAPGHTGSAVDDSSRSAALARQRAAALPLTGDPQWCPTGVSPRNAATGGCSVPRGSLSDLVNLIFPVPHSNGVIWIQSGNDPGLDVTINGLGNWAADRNFSLTLMGGWNGVPFKKIINGVSTFDTAINIVNWNGRLTIQNITMSGVPINLVFPGYAALYVTSRGKITLNSVVAMNTTGLGMNGVLLDNSTSTTGAPISVNNGVFVKNYWAGLNIFSKGAVTLKNVVADSNINSYGVVMDNSGAASAKAVVISNSEFNGNNYGGVLIGTRGPVTLTNLSATFNLGPGAYAYNGFVGCSAGVTIKGVNNFSNNRGYGLHVESNGAIKLSNITSNFNVAPGPGTGVLLINSAATAARPITITGSLTAMGNAGRGLDIQSKGTVTATNLTTSDNGSHGTFIDNCLWNGSTCLGSGAVKIGGTNLFNGNHAGIGLYIASRGAVTLSNLTALRNGFTENVWTAEAQGVVIFNTLVPAIQSPVTITGNNLIAGNTRDGMLIQSYGAVTLSNFTVQSNGLGIPNGNGAGASIINSGGVHPKPVTIKGTNIFYGNDGFGLGVTSYGNVTISNVTANDNGLEGTRIENCVYNGSACLGSGAVKITGTNSFNNNHAGAGLRIQSRGAVTLSNLTAMHNGYTGNVYTADVPGVTIRNAWLTSVQSPVTITGTNRFEDNARDGLVVLSYGAVTLSNLTAHANGLGIPNHIGAGVLAENEAGDRPKPITIKGINVFTRNDSDGLVVISDGAITVSKITSTYNGGHGGYLDNGLSPTQAKVTISGYGVFEWNSGAGDSGLKINSQGPITLANISANYNAADGAVLVTKGVSKPQPVTLSGINNFNFNGHGGGPGGGLWVTADGNIKVSNINASYNAGNGAILDNCLESGGVCHGVGSVNLTGFGNFNGNVAPSVFGLAVLSHGSVTLNHVTANGNLGLGATGIYIRADGNAKLVCSSAYGNVGAIGVGLHVTMPVGRILTLIGFSAYGNTNINEDIPHGGFSKIVRAPCP